MSIRDLIPSLRGYSSDEFRVITREIILDPRSYTETDEDEFDEFAGRGYFPWMY